MIYDPFNDNFPFKFWFNLEYTLSMNIVYGLLEMTRDQHKRNGVKLYQMDRVLTKDKTYNQLRKVSDLVYEWELHLRYPNTFAEFR